MESSSQDNGLREALGLQHLYKIYKEGDIETVALRDAQLSVKTGEFVAITGRSGAGKTTLMNLMGGLSTPSAGRVVVGGTDLARLAETARAVFRRQNIGIVFQSNNLIPFLSALENVMLPMQLAGRKDGARRAHTLLARMGLAGREQHRPGMLSGGERQRVSIARALAVDPRIILMDEPFSALDVMTRHRMRAEIVDIWRKTGKTIVFVTHEVEEALELADRIVVLSRKPTTVRSIMEVVEERPRDPESPALKAMHRELRQLIGAAPQD
jgi:NitT/TauT family transport system ATP-binding protein